MGEERAREVLILSGMHESTNQAIGLVPHHIVMRAMLAFADEARLAERAAIATWLSNDADHRAGNVFEQLSLRVAAGEHLGTLAPEPHP